MGGGRLQELNHRTPLLRRDQGTSALWKIINCMQRLSYNMCTFMWSLKFFVYSKYNSAGLKSGRSRLQEVVIYFRFQL